MHVPKTGGSTVIQFLEQQFDENEIARWLYAFRLIEMPREFFATHRYFHGHVDYEVMCAHLETRPVAITFLRDPVERFLSQFGNHKRVTLAQIPDWTPAIYEAFQTTSLEDFLFAPPQALVAEAAGWQNKHARMLVSDVPTFELARKRLDEFVFVGITEYFPESLFLLAYTFGWLPATEFEIRNKSPNGQRPDQAQLSERVIEEIRRQHEIDLELWRHADCQFQARYRQMCLELLEQYGSRAHARLKLPLSLESVRELLDAHYRRRFIERQPSVRHLRLDFAQKISGHNWHDREPSRLRTTFRWSGPGNVAFLDLPIHSMSAVWFRCSVLISITANTLADLVLRVNGHIVPIERTPQPNGPVIIEARIPADVIALQHGCMRVSFELKETTRPADVLAGSQDRRSVGIAVDWIEVLPEINDDRPRKVLVFMPFGHRSGSEVGLAEFIHHADREAIQFAVACPQDGPLLQELPSDVQIFNYRRPEGISDETAIEALHHRLMPDLWYISTIVQPRIIRLARTLNVRSIVHTHELEEPLEVLNPADLQLLTTYPDLVIAISEGAADIFRVLGRSQQLEVCHSPIDVKKIRTRTMGPMAIRERLGVGHRDFLWVMAGTHNHVKNPSLFVDVAAALAKRTSRARFAWLGETNNAYSVFVKEKAKQSGLADRLSWIVPQPNEYYDYLNAADGFVLTSRTESLSLVLLEAAALGKPIVAFESPGPREIFRPGMGALVDRLDAASLVESTLGVMNGTISFVPEVSKRRAEDFDVAIQAKRWQGILKKHLDFIRQPALA